MATASGIVTIGLSASTTATCGLPLPSMSWLSGASTVQAALAALVREDILAREGTRYVVVDSLLREWIARKTY